MDDGTDKYYYHFDGLGSVTEITDDSGAIVEKYEYDAYGKTVIKDASDIVLTISAIGNPYGFTGRELDSETGLYYYRARYYSPELGRSLQTDPIGYYGGINLYTYVGNSPLNWVDSWGLLEEKPSFWNYVLGNKPGDIFTIGVSGVLPIPIFPFIGWVYLLTE